MIFTIYFFRQKCWDHKNNYFPALYTLLLDRSTSSSVMGWLFPTRCVHKRWMVGRPLDIEGQLRNKPALWMNKQSQTKLAVFIPGQGGPGAGGSATHKNCLRLPWTGSSVNMGHLWAVQWSWFDQVKVSSHRFLADKKITILWKQYLLGHPIATATSYCFCQTHSDYGPPKMPLKLAV